MGSKLRQKNIKLYIVERDENEEIKYAGDQKSNKLQRKSLQNKERNSKEMYKRLGERTMKERDKQIGKVEERVVRKCRNEKGTSKKLGRGAKNEEMLKNILKRFEREKYKKYIRK